MSDAVPRCRASTIPPSATAATPAGAAAHRKWPRDVACAGATANGGARARPSVRIHSAYWSAAPGGSATRSAGESSSGGETCSTSSAVTALPEASPAPSVARTSTSSRLGAAVACTGTV